MRHRWLILAGVAATTGALSASSACSGDSAAPPSTASAGAAGKAGGAAQAGNTAKAGASAAGAVAGGGPAGGGGAGQAGEWGALGFSNTGSGGYMTIPAGTYKIDCGPGCREVMQVPIANTRETYVIDGEWIGAVAEWRKAMVYAKLGDPTTRVVGNLPGKNPALGIPAMRGGKMAVEQYWMNTQSAQFWLFDLESGASKEIGAKGTSVSWEGTLLSDTHLFVGVGGLVKMDLASGQRESWGPYARCFSPQLVGGKYTCTSEDRMRFLQWDLDAAGDPTEFAPTPQQTIQEGGRCTTDGSHCAWIDYRDAPGHLSNYDYRQGGEVYIKDMASGLVERLTYDSPDATRLKKYVSAGNTEYAVWQECPKVTSGPISVDSILASCDLLTKLDRKTQQRCRYPFRSGAYHLLGRKLLAVWGSPTDPVGYVYVVELDLDSTDIPWVCEKNFVP